jgi:hypothetical protein
MQRRSLNNQPGANAGPSSNKFGGLLHFGRKENRVSDECIV